MRAVSLTKPIIAILAVSLVVAGSAAGYFHDQSIKGVYSSLTPQIYDLKNQIDARDAQISQLKTQVSTLQGQVVTLQDQVATLNGLVSSLQSQNKDLKAQIVTLQAQIATLQKQVSDLQATIDNLQRATVDGWFTFDGTQCYYYCYVRGAYGDFGTQAARNVVLTLTWKNDGAFVQSNTISLANLAGRTVALYPETCCQQYFPVAAPANQLSWSFTWTS